MLKISKNDDFGHSQSISIPNADEEYTLAGKVHYCHIFTIRSERLEEFLETYRFDS